MGKRGHGGAGMQGNKVFWQSAASNQISFRALEDQIINMALSRFEWTGLPDTCDGRYLEWTLLNNGTACICRPSGGGPIMSLQAAQVGVNAYGNPRSWRAVGDNGTCFNSDWRNGAFIWENMARSPIRPLIRMYASELAELRQLKRINRNAVKQPFIVTGPRTLKNAMVNLYKQIDGNEPAIIANDDLSMVNVDILQTGAPYLAHDINEDIENQWRLVYHALGINNLPFKAERQTEDEINNFAEPVMMTKMSPLACRREAARRANEALGTNINVVWRGDWLDDVVNEQFNFDDDGTV